MPGPPPKNPALRQRRNRTSTAAKLTIASSGGSQGVAKTPSLPIRANADGLPHPWHALTLEFWQEVWASPMAAEYIAADVPGLTLLATLVDRFHYGAHELAAEIRLQRQCFGLTPLDRRRLQWEIGRAEEAERKRPKSGQPAEQSPVAKDPRRNLRAVK